MGRQGSNDTIPPYSPKAQRGVSYSMAHTCKCSEWEVMVGVGVVMVVVLVVVVARELTGINT